jgi:hypothetical protein
MMKGANMNELTLITLGLISNSIENTTMSFLDNNDLDQLENNPLTISYRGISVEIPLDYPELNSAVQDTLKHIMENIKICL